MTMLALQPKRLLLAVFAAVLLVAVSASAASAATYTVRSGDTLHSIARAHQTSVAQLVKDNRLTNPSLIRVGQKLVVETSGAPVHAPVVSKPAVPGQTVALPTGSGSGKRIVYAKAQQRVWLVDASGRVASTYRVSGHRTGTLPPLGTHTVRSKSIKTQSLSGRETMTHMVRFYKPSGGWVGFHSIPLDRAGRPVQSEKQLGTALSIGCIRQADADARRLWDFASVGTKVVVVR
jgi:LysM repeat protein